jgi:hypothetical protein
MGIGEIYVPLAVGFPRDPKIRTMVFEHGQDGILAAYLYIMMCLYCRENLTDGWVPVAEMPLLAYPLDRTTTMQLASLLQEACLVGASAVHKPPAMQVHAYVKRNGTRQDVERTSDLRRHAARKRWAIHPVSNVHSSVQSKNDARYAGARAAVETESIKHPSPVPAPDARARETAGGEIDLPSIVQHEIRTLTGGLDVGRERAVQIAAEIIGDRRPNSPAAYVRSALRSQPDLFALAEPAGGAPGPAARRRRNTAADTPAAQVAQEAATVDGRPRAAPASDEQRQRHADAARAALAAKANGPPSVTDVPLPADPADPPF